MARRSCRNSALVRSYARKAGGDGSLQARFALRPTAPPMFAHTRCSHIVWRAYGAAARVLTRAAPELRSPAATFTAASFRQPCAHGSRVPRSCPPHGASCLAADVAANGRCGRAHPTATAQPVARPVSQPPAPRHVLPPTAVYPRSFSRQRFSSTQRTKKATS